MLIEDYKVYYEALRQFDLSGEDKDRANLLVMERGKAPLQDWRDLFTQVLRSSGCPSYIKVANELDDTGKTLATFVFETCGNVAELRNWLNNREKVSEELLSWAYLANLLKGTGIVTENTQLNRISTCDQSITPKECKEALGTLLHTYVHAVNPEFDTYMNMYWRYIEENGVSAANGKLGDYAQMIFIPDRFKGGKKAEIFNSLSDWEQKFALTVNSVSAKEESDIVQLHHRLSGDPLKKFINMWSGIYQVALESGKNASELGISIQDIEKSIGIAPSLRGDLIE